jgi:uncharacterized protein (TIGR02246 family)
MTDDEAVLATFEDYAAAYCAKDADGVMAVFDPGDDISLIGTGADELCTGHDQIRAVFERNFTDATATRFEWHWRQVTRRSDTASVAATLTIHLRVGDEALEVPVRWTVALHRDGTRWRWLHRHASAAASNQDNGAAYPVPNGIDS